MILKISLDLPGDGTYLRIARRVGHTLMQDLGVVQQDITDIEFIIGELCTNVVRHARTTADSRYTVTLEYHADRVAIAVEDQGIGFSLSDVGTVGSLRPDRDGTDRLGGFGLELIRLMADHIEFRQSEPQGTTVVAEKALHFNTPAEARQAEELADHPGGEVRVSAS